MAIINCPECNELTSTTIGKCVHCGSELLVCPECGSVSVKGVAFCSKCGFKFENDEVKKTSAPAPKQEYNRTMNSDSYPTGYVKNESATPSENQHKNQNNANNNRNTYHDGKDSNAEKRTAIDTYNGWKNQSAIYTLFKVLGILNIIMVAITTIWIILPAFKLISSTQNMFENYDNLIMAVLVTEVLYILFSVLKFSEFIQQGSYKKWCVKNNIDNKVIIANTISFGYSKLSQSEVVAQTKALKFVADAESSFTDSSVRSKKILQIVLLNVLSVLNNIIVAAFVISSASNLIAMSVFYTNLSLSDYMDTVLLVLAGIITLTSAILFKTLLAKYNAAHENWIKSNFPNLAKKYRNHMEAQSLL